MDKTANVEQADGHGESLEQAEQRFRCWRESRKQGGRIPPALWSCTTCAARRCAWSSTQAALPAWPACAMPSGVRHDPDHAAHAHSGGGRADRLSRRNRCTGGCVQTTPAGRSFERRFVRLLAIARARGSRFWCMTGMASGFVTNDSPAGGSPSGPTLTHPPVRCRPVNFRCCSWVATRRVPMPRRRGGP